jgi:hypothetical protein
MVLDGIEERKARRAERWERNKEKRVDAKVREIFVCF